MLVMMPQVHCVEGSRVKNIKKQFEVLSNESTVESDGNGACAISPPKELKVTEKQKFQKAQSFPLMHDVSLPSEKRSVNSKENAIKNEKCNIKRTPAFRCDRIVKGKNVTGQTREKHISVEDKVKLFEDGHSKVSDTNQGKLATITEHSSVKGSGQDSNLPKGGSAISKPARLKYSPNSEKLEHKLKRSADSPHQLVSTKCNSNEVPVRAPHPNYNKTPKDKILPESSKLRNGVGPHKSTIFKSQDTSHSKDSMRDIMRNPLPTGPPPRKPPRTFAHVGPKSTMLNVTPKTPTTSIKLKESPERFNNAHDVPPVLIRSKTESQIQLRSKLETALSKHTPESGNIRRSPVIESKPQNWSHPIPVRSPNKPDLSPSSLLVGCLRLGCVNDNNYEEVGVLRTANTRPGDRRESLDIRLSSADVVEAKNNLVSFGRSQSQDHIYAVPFGDFKSPDKGNSKMHSFHPVACDSPIHRGDDLKTKELVKLQNPETNGLHYMCTPILSQEKPMCTDGGFPTPSAAVQHLNSIGIGRVQKGSSSQPSLKGLVKYPENPQPLGNQQIQPIMNQSIDRVQPPVPAESPMDDSRESSLAFGFGKDCFNKGSKTSLCSPSTETEEENWEDEHDPMMEEILEKRKGYVRRVCGIFQQMQMETTDFTPILASSSGLGKSGQNSKLSTSINPNHSTSLYSSSHPPTPFPHMFECILLVGLTLSSNQNQEKCYEPYIKSKFPADVLVPQWIEHLCFPDAVDWPLCNSVCSSKGSVKQESKKKDGKAEDDLMDVACRDNTYSLVITGQNGKRRFGYCRRVLPEGGSLCLPLNYCLISPYRANGFYFKILAELESRHGQPEAERMAFLEELYSCALPGPGQIPSPSLSSSASPSASPSPFLASLRRPLDTRLEERDEIELFCCLEVRVFLDVFASILLERKVILTSKSLSKLSSCIEALQSLLYPFSWQHTFIPVLPAPMLDICHAPTPYIIGVLKGCNGQVPSITLDEGIMVDLDTSQYLQRVGDEDTILPPRIKRTLRGSLRLASGIAPIRQPNSDNKSNSGPDGDSPMRNVLVSEAFIRMFLMAVGHYPNHIAVQQDGRRVFQRKSFIKAMPFLGVQIFLEWFTETAMFCAFIDSRLEGGTECKDGVFEQRAHKFCEGLEQDPLLLLKNYKSITKKHKTLGDRFKDWASFS